MTQSSVGYAVDHARPVDLEGYEALAALALDMYSVWNHATDFIWRTLDPVLWKITRNPWVVLTTVSRDKLQQALAEPAFRANVDQLLQRRREAVCAPAWFQLTHGEQSLRGVAYFSMEFMLGESLPIYSGGLGNVAGDQLKAAGDLGVPVSGVGLLYQQGYFRQVIDQDGVQQALYPYNDPGQLPIAPLRAPNGEWLRLEVALPGYSVWLRAWQVQVGRLRLYLLDSNDAANYPEHRGITSELYGGGPELRLKQELVLGIGGWRLLQALGLDPEVCHLNEGHAAFAVLERCRSFMRATSQSFATALAATRAGNVFTTHTAVEAGFDRFAPALIERYLGEYAEQQLGLSRHELLALGRRDAGDASESFNMAYLAIRGAGAVNGVSRLHGHVSRQLFLPLFPRWPIEEIPVAHVTNGVHVPTWDSAPADELWTRACGPERWRGTADTVADNIREASPSALWQLRSASRAALVQYARERLSMQLAVAGAPAAAVAEALGLFDPKTLTLGFARRFAAYKRPNLLLHDPARLQRLLTNARRPVQLIIAGKAHPADRTGQTLIQQWIHFVRRPEVRSQIIFLADYDMCLTEHLVQGVDVWINTPQRPWEASGTSGMKVLVNGGINLSELDGWWAEAYSPDVGWAIGDGLEHGDDPAWNAAEAEALYDVLENEVIPQFYARGPDGIPHAWVERMRESMAQLTVRYSTNRVVREYTESYYLPAAAAYRERAADRGAEGKAIADWQRVLQEQWRQLRFGELRVATQDGAHRFEVEVYFHDLAPDWIAVELYAAGDRGVAALRQPMRRVDAPVGPSGRRLFEGQVPASRPTEDYTIRLFPRRTGVAVPLEIDPILWQH